MDFLADYYLTHPFESRHEVREWELGIEDRTGISLFNPFYDIHRLEIIAIDKGRGNMELRTKILWFLEI